MGCFSSRLRVSQLETCAVLNKNYQLSIVENASQKQQKGYRKMYTVQIELRAHGRGGEEWL